MSIERFYTQTISVERLAPTTANPDISEYGTSGDIPCHVQQVTAEDAAFIGGVFGQTWRVFCDPSEDIKETDKIIFSGERYTIKGIKDLSVIQQAVNKHLELVMVKTIS